MRKPLSIAFRPREDIHHHASYTSDYRSSGACSAGTIHTDAQADDSGCKASGGDCSQHFLPAALPGVGRVLVGKTDISGMWISPKLPFARRSEERIFLLDCLFVWIFIFELSGKGGPAGNHATAGRAQMIMRPREHPHQQRNAISRSRSERSYAVKTNANNVVISPLSAAVLLALTRHGAAGATEQQIASALQLTEGPQPEVTVRSWTCCRYSGLTSLQVLSQNLLFKIAFMMADH
ncbi:Protein of unknown function [Gryllus bimaculatus]|nr:Protein of unknown function [Gryllus bimaculatus]